MLIREALNEVRATGKGALYQPSAILIPSMIAEAVPAVPCLTAKP
ncbi:MAG: hypothetical protein V9E96_19935 [Chitinophagaceae bacterium]